MTSFISIFLALSSLFTLLVHEQNEKEEEIATPQESISCADELKDILDIVYQLPSAKSLLSNALADGPIYIERNQSFSQQFDAYWAASSRTIFLNRPPTATQSELLWPLLFELHNATRQQDFQHFDHLAKDNQISRPKYIQEIEYIEYQNALATSALFEEAIEQGAASADSRRKYSDNFANHFRFEEEMGHTDWVGKIYDELNISRT